MAKAPRKKSQSKRSRSRKRVKPRLKFDRSRSPDINKMSKLRDLVAMTPKKIRLNSKPLRCFWRTKGEDRFDNRLNVPYRLYVMRTKPPRSNKTQQIFTQWIRVYGQTGPGAPSVGSQRVWVSCSCEYFKYNLEVALAMNGSSSIRYSNGMIPISTNPSMKKHLCKHLYKLADRVSRLEATKLRREQRRRKSEVNAHRTITPTEMLSELLL